MLTHNTKISFFHNSSKLIDLLLLSISFHLAVQKITLMHLTFGFNKTSFNQSIEYYVIGFSFLLIWHFFFRSLYTYNYNRHNNFLKNILNILKGTTYCILSIIIVNLFYPIHFVNINFITLFWINSSILLILFSIIRFFLQNFFIGQIIKTSHILIIGTGERAVTFAKKIISKPELGYMLKGFVDKEWQTATPKDNLPPIITDFDNLSAYLRENVIDEIFNFLPIKSFYEQISKIISAAEEQGVILRYSVDIFNPRHYSLLKYDQIEKEQLLSVYTGKMFNKTIIIKNIIDFVSALLLIIIFFPVFIITAISIKLTSPGPVFFIQKRLGKNKRLFNLIKFRTMVVNAEKMLKDIEHLNERKGEAAFKLQKDPRITHVGKILRKLSIDELPQLFNVLKGDMSLVGPRPLPVRDYEGFEKDWQRRRFSVKPGITCIWQVSGRDNISFENWMKMDMHYIDNWSLWLDCKLLIKTIPATIFGSGAS